MLLKIFGKKIGKERGKMNKKKTKEILNVYDEPKMRVGNVLLKFARQSIEDIKQIEKMKTKELKDEWKGLVWLNHVYGQVSINELQRIDLIELEMESRNIKPAPLNKWFKESLAKYEKEIQT
jgi:hypothetical protein